MYRFRKPILSGYNIFVIHENDNNNILKNTWYKNRLVMNLKFGYTVV